MEAAQEAAAARDKLLDDRAAAEAELQALQAKLKRQTAAVSAAADAEQRVCAAEAKCRTATAEASSSQMQVGHKFWYCIQHCSDGQVHTHFFLFLIYSI